MAKQNRVTFEQKLCKGCELCIPACPPKIVALDMSKVNSKGYNPAYCIDMDKCTACAMCARICPDSVITVESDV
jgi:2-oxoglutarate ferredoxin oxidoreductase subunit delta